MEFPGDKILNDSQNMWLNESATKPLYTCTDKEYNQHGNYGITD